MIGDQSADLTGIHILREHDCTSNKNEDIELRNNSSQPCVQDQGGQSLYCGHHLESDHEKYGEDTP